MNPVRYIRLFLCIFVVTTAHAENAMRLNALDEYVRKADDNDYYSWSVHSETETDGVRNVIVDMEEVATTTMNPVQTQQCWE